MQNHPYIGMKATRPAIPKRYLQEASGIIVAIGTGSTELEVGALHYVTAILLLEDGGHREVMLDDVVVDPAEAAARLAPGKVERWQSFALANFAHPDDVVGGDPPEGWEGAGLWEAVMVAAPVDISHYPQVLWRRPLRRVESQKAEV